MARSPFAPAVRASSCWRSLRPHRCAAKRHQPRAWHVRYRRRSAHDHAHLAANPLLAPLVAARPGLRVAGSWHDIPEPDALTVDAELVCALQLRTGQRVTAATLLAHAERWRPWRAYAAAHLRANLREHPTTRHN